MDCNSITRIDHGKCFSLGTPILRYDCTITPVEKLKVGDTLIGSDGCPTKIIEIHKGIGKLYRVDQANGSSYTVNENHILMLKSVIDSKIEKTVEISISEYMKLTKIQKKKLMGFKTQIKSLEHNETFSDDLKYGLDKMYEYGTTLAELQVDIPTQFKYLSIESRLHLLAGIIDTIGVLCDDFYELFSEKKPFTDDIIFLARSIGIRTYTQIRHNENKIIIINEGHVIIPVRKKENICVSDCTNYMPYVTEITVTYVENCDYVGFQLDNNGEFIWTDCTVMHDSTLVYNGKKKIDNF